jgi:predicted ATPase/DNA-binding CsgD family transcriptional regulator
VHIGWRPGLARNRLRQRSEVNEIRSNAPQEPNSFVGRERELDELRRLVRSTRALTLCGAAGIGKTRLALRIMATATDEEFPDGAWLADLGDLRQPDLVVSRVAAVIGVSEEPGRPLLETLADALAGRQLLLALDNCEHLIEACARICQRLLDSSPGLHLIATSREPLRVAAETVWQVPPLSVAPAGASAGAEDAGRYEAVRLFADRAAAAFSGFAISPANAEVVAALCRALDGIPLAIELAAARVRALSVEQIAARLVDRFGLLTTGNRAGPLRQQTLRAAIDWSYELLTSQEQVLLRRLSVFAGWSLEMAEEVCADDDYIPAHDMLDLITALVDKSLVVREREVLGQARYRLLDSIREYAAACLAEAGEATAFRARLRDYLLRVAENNLAVGMALIPGPWSARVDVFRRYDVDVGNVWQVLSYCLADTDTDTGLRICTAVRPCWLVRGTFAEGIEWLDSFLDLDAPDSGPGVRGAALIGRAQLALSSDRAAAEAGAEEGLELSRSAGDDFWTASGLNLLAEIALHTGRIDAAASCADEALSIAQKADDGWNEGYALGVKAAIAGLRGKLREGQQLAQASIDVMRRIDQQWGVARGLLGLGDLARVRQDPDDAHGRYLEALSILREIDARPEIARCLAGLGRVAMDLGDAELARQHLTESLRLSHSTGSRIGVARGLEAFAGLAVAQDQPELAVQLTAAATALRDAAGLAALSGARAERYLASARRLGEPAVARLWTKGLALSADAAVALALDAPPPAPAPTGPITAVRPGETPPALPGILTARERQVVALVARGSTNKAIAEELFISPATAARHVANVLAKLGFTKRAQIAAWAADRHLDLTGHASRHSENGDKRDPKAGSC